MPHLNQEQIDGLISAAGVDQTREILAAFWRSSEGLLADLNNLLLDDQFEAAFQAAHALKGAAANVGARTIEERARDIETACRASQSVSSDELNILLADFSESREAFARHLDQFEANGAD